MPSKPFGQTLGGVVVFNLSNYQRVIASDHIIYKRHIRLRSTRLLILKRKAGQEPIELLDPAVKCFDNVPPIEFFNPA